MDKLAGRIALTTDGRSGVGLASAKRFAAEGATVIITGRQRATLDAALASIPGATGFEVDSASHGELNTLSERIGSDFGRLDVRFVNAGGGGLPPLGTISEADFDDAFDRNVKGTLFAVQKTLALLASGASFILNSSTSAAKATAGFSVYSASKAEVHAFTRNWMIDPKGRNIRIYTPWPWPTETPGLCGLAGPDEDNQRELLRQMALGVPMERVGDPDEIARAALFLASDELSFVTGSELFVDGGEGHA